MAVPSYDKIFTPFLLRLKDRNEHSLSDILQFVINYFDLTEEDKKLVYSSNGKLVIRDRVGWARTYLKKAGLIEATKRAVFQISESGANLLSKKNNVTLDDLKQIPVFMEFYTGTSVSLNNKSPQSNLSETPTDQIETAILKLNDELAKTILENIQEKVSDFDFERLVVGLLLKMGYGDIEYNQSAVTRKTGDGGVDGIISSDKLGLDSIYVQAKKWKSEHKIGRPELQSFAGACLNTSKLIFITTSSFTDQAISYATTIETTGKKMVLIDGMRLANLMIEYDYGVSTEKVYSVKKIDTDFFDDFD